MSARRCPTCGGRLRRGECRTCSTLPGTSAGEIQDRLTPRSPVSPVPPLAPTPPASEPLGDPRRAIEPAAARPTRRTLLTLGAAAGGIAILTVIGGAVAWRGQGPVPNAAPVPTSEGRVAPTACPLAGEDVTAMMRWQATDVAAYAGGGAVDCRYDDPTHRQAPWWQSLTFTQGGRPADAEGQRRSLRANGAECLDRTAGGRPYLVCLYPEISDGQAYRLMARAFVDDGGRVQTAELRLGQVLLESGGRRPASWADVTPADRLELLPCVDGLVSALRRANARPAP